LEHPEDPEDTEHKTERCGGEAIGIGRAVANHEARCRASQRGRRPRTDTGTRALSGVVAGPADVANHGVGGVGDAAVSTMNPEQIPNRALYPTGAGGIVGAGG
jgi:hypothetical protein